MELTVFEPVDPAKPRGEWKAVIVTGWGMFKRERLFIGDGLSWYRYADTNIPMIPWTPATGDITMMLAGAWAARRWKDA